MAKKTIPNCINCSPIPLVMLDRAFRTVMKRGSTFMEALDFDKNTDLFRSLNRNEIESVFEMGTPKNELKESISLSFGLFETDFIPTFPEYSMTYTQWILINHDTNSNYWRTTIIIQSVQNSVNYVISKYQPIETSDPIDLNDIVNTIKSALSPYSVLKNYADSNILIDNISVSKAVSGFNFSPIYISPVIDLPLIDPLLSFYNEFLCPNIGDVKDNTITLMQLNRPFIEAYMVGMNHELNRRLLWDEFPTDQRITPFKTFFHSHIIPLSPGEEPSTERMAELMEGRDIYPIDTWGKESDLGKHNPKRDINMILVIRAELIRKFPNLYLYAQKGKWELNPDPHPHYQRSLDDNSNIVQPIFFISDKDVYMFGFPFTKDEIKGSPNNNDNEPGYFFVFQERAGDPRFGFGLPGSAQTGGPFIWEDLNWGDIAGGTLEIDDLNYIPISLQTNSDIPVSLDPKELNSELETDSRVSWGKNSADMAYIFYDKDVKLAVHASTMLPVE